MMIGRSARYQGRGAVTAVVGAVTILLAACSGGGTDANVGANGGDAATGTETEASAPDPAVDSQDVRVGTTQSASAQFVYGTQLSSAINRVSEIQRWNAIETGGSTDNHALLERGEVDVILSIPALLRDAKEGVGAFEEAGPRDDLRLLWTWVHAPQPMVARSDAGVSNVAELDGKPVFPGATGTSTGNIYRDFFEVLDIDPEYVDGSVADAVTYMQDETVVAFGKASAGLAPDSTFLELLASTELTPVGFNSDQTEAILAEYPATTFVEIPPDTVVPGSDSFVTWVIPIPWVTTADFPEDLAYEAIKIATEEQERIAETYPPSGQVDFVTDTIEAAIAGNTPLHPGVVRYFEEQGAEIPDEVRP